MAKRLSKKKDDFERHLTIAFAKDRSVNQSFADEIRRRQKMLKPRAFSSKKVTVY